MAKFDIRDFRGVIPAMAAVFDENENVCVERTKELVDWQLDHGVRGFYLTGSTGEAFLMDAAERNLIVDTVIKHVNGRVPVVVHVGDIGTKKSIALAEYAYKAGADGISSVPPFYWKFSASDIFGYYKDISEAAPLPMIVYNIPLAGIMSLDTIFKLAELEQVRGVKYTATTHDEIIQIKHRLGSDFMLYSGCDEMAVSGILAGADGLIGSFYNVIPEFFTRLYECLEKNDIHMAARCQKIATLIIKESLAYDFLSVIKVMLNWRGIDAGCCRRPFTRYTADEMEPLRKKLLEIGESFQADDFEFFRDINRI